MKRILLWAVAALLSGCVVGQHIDLDYQPQSQAAARRLNAVGLQVSDERPYVRNGDKSPWYIGHYRGRMGKTWDVSTQNKAALADLMRTDLQQELDSLGYARATPSAPRSLGVQILDWNFDSYVNSKVWYDLKLTVRDARGKVLAQSEIHAQQEIRGHLLTGAKGVMEKGVPRIYGEVIRAAVRDNPAISAALKG